jgi:hypothetical protein
MVIFFQGCLKEISKNVEELFVSSINRFSKCKKMGFLLNLHSKNINNAKSEVRFKHLIRDP